MSRAPFDIHRGTVVPLLHDHIDTDQIIPKQFLTRIERSGFGDFLFHDWRTGADGRPDPGFPLNQAAYAGASILVAGANFGCGSSREHAVWALTDFGIRSVVAVSFADIFFTNAVGNGLLPAAVSAGAAADLAARAAAGTLGAVEMDLERGEIRTSAGEIVPFSVPALARRRLLDGDDDIDRILRHEPAIAAHERGSSWGSGREM